MCGLVAILSPQKENIHTMLYDAILTVQHRGQDAAGIATIDGDRVKSHRKIGLVNQIFDNKSIEKLTGNIGLAHVRYPTAGSDDVAETQPFYSHYPYGLVIVHNGNLVNTTSLQQMLDQQLMHVNTASDSQLLLYVFATALADAIKKGDTFMDALESAVKHCFESCEGGYAVVIHIIGKGMVAFRDPHGIRPLVYGTQVCTGGQRVMFASESVSCEVIDFEMQRDVAPGEMIFVDEQGQMTCKTLLKASRQPCLFEYIYFARPDSWMEGISVHQARVDMGIALAKKLQDQGHDIGSIDIVSPVPETSSIAAQSCAQALQIPYQTLLVKSRYLGRTFIMANQAMRKRSIRHKLNAVSNIAQGKTVLLIDDSIVRGNTAREVIAMLRAKGIAKIILASLSPKICYRNVYGIDITDEQELIASGRHEAAIAEQLGADQVIYQDLDDLKAVLTRLNPNITTFEDSVFTGHYICGAQ